ncbi:MAG: TRAP transporter small permease [Rhodovarius sp.]|nr:TRAP transporter small permease [Rhodovarius sp.]MCX7932361.1 TRAP transporter small permease [Rhodovarius sp.]MDW8315140.1 TRAP transporter small permease [Rhodovarius sp.]
MSGLLRAAARLRRAVAALAALMAYLAGWNYIACAAFIGFDIVARNLFGFSSRATVEVTGYMLACGIAWALAHTLMVRAHIRVDVLLNRLPLSLRAPLHLFALLLLAVFAAFCAWAGWALVDESLLFNAHDNSALRIPLAIPQGIWAIGILAFALTAGVLLVEGLLNLLAGRPQEVDRLLASRGFREETEEALQAARMIRQ